MNKKRNKTKHFISIAFSEIKMYLSSEFQYRGQIFIWVIADIIQPILLGFVWIAVARSGGGTLSVEQVISYFFLVAIISKLTRDWSVAYISNQIISGEFSKYLLKPFNYLSETLGISIATRVLRMSFLIPLLVISSIFLKQYFVYDFSLINTALFTLSVLLGFVINYLLGNTFALLAFFVNQILGLRSFYENIATFLSGEGIPLSAFPVWAFAIAIFLPFRYTISFPVEIALGILNQEQMIQGFGVACLWILFLIVLYKLLFKLAVKRYESVGI